MLNSLHSKAINSPDLFKTLICHLWDRTTVNDNLCFLFNGARNKDGYGIVRFNDRAWIISRLIAVLYGILPSHESNLGALHKCSNRNCWNPAHLYAGTQKQNGQDLIKDRTHCKNGHPYSKYGYIAKERNRLGNPVRRCRLCRRLK